MIIMQRSQTKLKSVTRGRPCPLCEGTDGCSIGDDGLFLCRRREGEQPGFVCLGRAKADGQWTQYRREGDPLLSESARPRPANGQAHKPAIDWRAKAEALVGKLTPALADELAGILGLPVAVLWELPLLGFCLNGPFGAECWTFPEVDSAGRVIGLTCRHRDGSKKAWPGGHRGLTVPARWGERDGPLLLLEGQSDTLTATAFGLAAIGRPSNMGGVDHLAELLRDFPTDRPIIVVGEYDANERGEWPGRDGAIATARNLSAKLGRPVPWALPPDKAKDLRQWALARKLPREGEGTADAWGDAGAAFLAALKPRGTTPEQERGKAAEQEASPCAFRWEPIDAAAFAAADYRPTWLCKPVLVAGQPAIIGGPQKALKTTIALDLAISLASGKPWLGEFPCPARKRVAVLSGESGGFALQETARRICAAKGIDLAGLVETLSLQFTLPQLANLEQLAALRHGLERDKVEAVFIDPLYLSLLAGGDGMARAENLYETGPLLLRVAQACLLAGATPHLLHHTKKGAGTSGDALDLTDLAFSGIAEFARQWILLNRREPFEPGSGRHRLWLVAGGSVGHGGQWGMDVEEGQLAEDFTGRKWEVVVKPAAEAREAKREEKVGAKADERRRRDQADATAFQAAYEQLAGDGAAVPYGRVRDLSGLSRDRASSTFERLLAAKVFERCEVSVIAGQGAKKPVAGLRRTRADGDGENLFRGTTC